MEDRDIRAPALLIALGCTWGASFLFIKVIVEEVSPVELVAGRLFFGTVAVMAFIVATKHELKWTPGVPPKMFVQAVGSNIVPFWLISWGEQHINSGTASVLNSTVPIFTAVFAAAFLMPRGGVESLLRTLQKGGPSRQSFVSYDAAGGGVQESEGRAPPGSQGLTFREVASLGFHFQVSFAAACYRLRELGYVNKAELDALLEQQEVGRDYAEFLGLEKRGAKKPTDDDEKELVAQLIPLVLEAYEREHISRGKLREVAEMLGLTESDVLRFAEG